MAKSIQIKKKRLRNDILNKKRFNKYLKRKLRRGRRKNHLVAILSPLLNYLYDNIFCKGEKFINSDDYVINIPKNFSLIENPEETLEILSKLIYAVHRPSIYNLFIDHSSCNLIDMDASTLMDIIIMEAKKEWSRRNKISPLHGRYSLINKVNEILKVAGLHKHIDHLHSHLLPEEVKKNYTTFDLVIGNKNDTIKPGMPRHRDFTATKLTDYFDNILKKHKVKLTISGKSKLSQLITEVLDNTEQHSNTAHWYVIGYRDEDGVCNIAIINFGDSIHKTLSSANLDSNTRMHITSLINKHTKTGLFNVKNNWSEESLWTLYALQEGISRFNTDESIKNDYIRGTGTTKLIDFFMQLSSKDDSNKPKMAIVSGNTYILFDNKYKLKDKNLAGGNRKIIAFNPTNDLYEKPDSNNVKTLKYYFPGTVISLRFKLDDIYLQSIIKENHND